MKRGKHIGAMATPRERVVGGWWKLVCKVFGHDPENRFTGDTICHRCRTGLGRWRS